DPRGSLQQGVGLVLADQYRDGLLDDCVAEHRGVGGRELRVVVDEHLLDLVVVVRRRVRAAAEAAEGRETTAVAPGAAVVVLVVVGTGREIAQAHEGTSFGVIRRRRAGERTGIRHGYGGCGERRGVAFELDGSRCEARSTGDDDARTEMSSLPATCRSGCPLNQ